MDNHSYAVNGWYIDEEVEKDEDAPIKFVTHRFNFSIEAEDISTAYDIAMSYMPPEAEFSHISLMG